MDVKQVDQRMDLSQLAEGESIFGARPHWKAIVYAISSQTERFELPGIRLRSAGSRSFSRRLY